MPPRKYAPNISAFQGRRAPAIVGVGSAEVHHQSSISEATPLSAPTLPEQEEHEGRPAQAPASTLILTPAEHITPYQPLAEAGALADKDKDQDKNDDASVISEDARACEAHSSVNASASTHEKDKGKGHEGDVQMPPTNVDGGDHEARTAVDLGPTAMQKSTQPDSETPLPRTDRVVSGQLMALKDLLRNRSRERRKVVD